MLIAHSKYDDLSAYFLLQLYSGQFPSRTAESCQHVIQNGDSTGKGECWIDPQSNGNPFKAFCEMTTDGGTLVLFVFKC